MTVLARAYREGGFGPGGEEGTSMKPVTREEILDLTAYEKARARDPGRGPGGEGAAPRPPGRRAHLPLREPRHHPLPGPGDGPGRAHGDGAGRSPTSSRPTTSCWAGRASWGPRCSSRSTIPRTADGEAPRVDGAPRHLYVKTAIRTEGEGHLRRPAGRGGPALVGAVPQVRRRGRGARGGRLGPPAAHRRGAAHRRAAQAAGRGLLGRNRRPGA